MAARTPGMRGPFRLLAAAASTTALLVAGAGLAPAQGPDPEPAEDVIRKATPSPVTPGLAPARDTEPVVMTGASFPTWSAPAQASAGAPGTSGLECLLLSGDAPDQLEDQPFNPFGTEQWGMLVEQFREAAGNAGHTEETECTHNMYEPPLASTGDEQDELPVSTRNVIGDGLDGKAVARIRGFAYTAGEWTEIPFQVDEMFTRYLSNNASGFAAYSETDQHHTYAFDREGFRFTESDSSNPCGVAPKDGIVAAPDPAPGLDHDDELAFMARDAGTKAPDGTPLPEGMAEAYEVRIGDPFNPAGQGEPDSGAEGAWVYVMLADEAAEPSPFGPDSGYVRYARDSEADTFLLSESRYRDYGNAPPGRYAERDAGGNLACTNKEGQRRPGDQGTVRTPRYRFRYEGRWLMTELNIAPGEPGGSELDESEWQYGPDLVDRWKARAFQQRRGGETPCCGFEDEERNWGGSSMLLGEKSGPVRAIRETWGADSGTNVVRREIFYRDEIRFHYYLRVHPVPPLDGIYAQWDYNAGRVTRYFNSLRNEGVDVDGANDEAIGNSFVEASCENGIRWGGNDAATDALRHYLGEVGEEVRDRVFNPVPGGCGSSTLIRNDVDVGDPTFQGPHNSLIWEQVTGQNGTLVSRWAAKQVTPGGTPQAVFAMPYYRDDACFDDGTGDNPGPLVGPGPGDADAGIPPCWNGGAAPAGDSDASLRQGAIGTHGLHLLLVGETDNAGTPLPLTEIQAEQRLVAVPGENGPEVGEAYGRHFEKPLVTGTRPFGGNGVAPCDPADPPSCDPGGLPCDPADPPSCDPGIGKLVTCLAGVRSEEDFRTCLEEQSIDTSSVPNLTELIGNLVGSFEEFGACLADGQNHELDGPTRCIGGLLGENLPPPSSLLPTTALTLEPATANATDDARLTARLTGAWQGHAGPIPGQRIRFHLEGASRTAFTDHEGKATVAIEGPSRAGSYTARATHLEPPLFPLNPGEPENPLSRGIYETLGSEATAQVTMEQEPTAITVEAPASLQVGDEITLVSFLTTDDGEPVRGRRVTFTHGPRSVSGTTDDAGRGSASYTVGGQEGSIGASFAGDADYGQSSTSTAVEVAAAPSPPAQPSPPPRGGAPPPQGGSSPGPPSPPPPRGTPAPAGDEEVAGVGLGSPVSVRGRPRLRSDLRYRARRSRFRVRRRGRTRSVGHRCAGSSVRFTIAGRDRLDIERVDFLVGARRVARDTGSPFSRVIHRRHLRRKRLYRLRARVTMHDGRRVTITRRVRGCVPRR